MTQETQDIGHRSLVSCHWDYLQLEIPLTGTQSREAVQTHSDGAGGKGDSDREDRRQSSTL